jgi:hypothetical protein
MFWFEVIRSYLCSPSVNMLTEHKASVTSIKFMHVCELSCIEPSGFMRKIRASREYMRTVQDLCVRFIKACNASTPSMLSVVNHHPCLSVSIHGSKDF